MWFAGCCDRESQNKGTMDHLLYEHVLDDPNLFAPAGNHRTIEICIRPDSAEPQVRETVLAEKQLASWCRDPKFDGPGSLFRLLLLSPRMAERDIWPLPLSSASLKSIMADLDIPLLFPRAVCKHIPLATPFESFTTAGRHGVMLRTNLSHTWQYALALVHDKPLNVTTGVLLGLRSNEINEVLHSVRHGAKRMICPAMLPCILMDKAFDALVKDAEERRKSLVQIRFETGSHGFHFPRASIKASDKDWDSEWEGLDLELLMQKLTSLSDACAGIAAVCRMQADFICVTRDLLACTTAGDNDNDSSLPSSNNGEARTAAATSHRYAAQQLGFLTQFLHGVESKVTYTKSSVQDQVQTIYTLLNQRESRAQVELARTSRRLAEITRRDSTDMRVIAAVTLVFLPATFTSTFFSASFFNFQPQNSGSGSGDGDGDGDEDEDESDEDSGAPRTRIEPDYTSTRGEASDTPYYRVTE